MLDRLLDEARAGQSGVLVLRGEAGVGKTALLEHAIESASGLIVLRAVGVESEMELAYAALHQLSAPLLDRVDRIPAPQREALETTFGLREGPVPDRFLVGLATLSLLSEAAQERPLVCAIDDAQWLDRASAQVLAFVARRLLAESVVFWPRRAASRKVWSASGARGGGPSGRRRASAVGVGDPGRLDERVADQLLAEARGNPLALLELPRGLSPAQLAGGFGLPGALSLSGKIEESFVNGSRRCLRTRSSCCWWPRRSRPATRTVVERGRALGIADAVLDPAESARLLEVDGRVRFRHPLVRSAVYRAATPHQRRRVHRALAEATDAQLDPDRRAWHLAEATAGPDEDVAAELERAAGRAQARGGLAAAAAFLERAAALTQSPSATRACAGGGADRVTKRARSTTPLALLDIAEAGAHRRARALPRVDLLRAQIAFAARRGSDAPPLLLEGRPRTRGGRPDPRARDLPGGSVCRDVRRPAGPRRAAWSEISEAALAGPPPPEPPRPSDLLLQGLAVRFTDGPAAGAPILKEALRAFRARPCCRPRRLVGSGSPAGSRCISSTTRPGRCSRRGTSTSSGRPGR